MTLPAITALDVLKEISINIPKEITLDVKEFSLNKNQVRMLGSTDSIESVDKIVAGLSESPYFENIEKGSVTSGFGADTKRFEINFTVISKGSKNAVN